MKITFNINYRAQWGQCICIIGKTDAENVWTEKQPLVLNCFGSENWSVQIALPDNIKNISYRYVLKNEDGTFHYDTCKVRVVPLNSKNHDYIVCDYWHVKSIEDTFFSTTFIKSLFKRTENIPPKKATKGNVVFRLQMPQVEPHQGVGVVGNIPELGNWDIEKKLVLTDQHFPTWEGQSTIKPYEHTIEYKYVIYELESGKLVDFEVGENRRLHTIVPKTTLVCSDLHFQRSQANWRAAGVAIPIFSLRTDESFGVGEFLDIKKMADWAMLTGQKMIQTLPINDTTRLSTNRDSYPYNAISVFALNPIYLNVERIGKLNKAQQAAYNATKAAFNEKTFVDYQVVVNEKWKYISALYGQEKANTFATKEYQEFFERNKEWLVPYAAFSYLRNKYNTANFSTWATHSTFDQKKIAELCSETSTAYEQIAIHYFIQYHLDKQLKEAVAYAHNIGVALKGDIPIGISPESVEAWSNPELFNLATQAGAPPDDFSVTGQNWGFPTYNWNVMEQDNFAWWAKRFSKMADYFDAYRIDHILGFFRIWEMSSDDVLGLTGRFSPALPYTLADIEHAGIYIDKKQLTTPRITYRHLCEVFGDKTIGIITTFFDDEDFELYRFKKEFDTQVKIANYFAENKFTNVEETFIKNQLLLLHCEVLFVPDLHEPDLYHPRIAMYQSQAFVHLDDYTKQKLMDLHHDFFYKRHNVFWKESALRKLPTLIQATDMLVCGEDLGMVPDTVPEVMNELQILSLEIQRMPKSNSIEFSHPNDAPYLSVCTTGTHDMNPLRAWWEEDKNVTQRYYNQIMGWWGEADKTCTSEIVRAIIDQHIYSNAIWVILPLQDWLACSDELRLPDAHAERINVPDNPLNFWCYRMHLSLEQLLQADAFNRALKESLKRANR